MVVFTIDCELFLSPHWLALCVSVSIFRLFVAVVVVIVVVVVVVAAVLVVVVVFAIDWVVFFVSALAGAMFS